MPQPGERLSRAEDGTTIKLEGRNLPPRLIVIQPDWNSRDMSSPATQEHIQGLKKSIMARIQSGLPGLFDPIKVRYIRSTGTPKLVDGECRLTAYLQLWDEGIEPLIPITDTDGDEADLRAASLIGNTGLPLTPLEIGLQCKRLNSGYLWSVEKIAEHICKPVRFVTEAIALHDAPAEAKALVAAGEVTPAAVRGELKKAAKEHRSPESIVEPLRKAVAARPAPPVKAQATFPGTKPAPKPKPVTRVKEPSAKEKIAKNAPKLLELADAFYRLYFDAGVDVSEVNEAAKAYGKARGL
jgi:hypothetical protein